MNKRTQLIKYLVSDYVASLLSWSLFTFLRETFLEGTNNGSQIFTKYNRDYFLGLALIPLFWLLIYYISGYYNEVFRKSRLTEFIQTLGNTLIGVILLFFTLLLDDSVHTNINYTLLFLSLFLCQFIFTYIPRLIITTITSHKVHRGEIGFNTLLIGSDEKAVDTYLEINGQLRNNGNRIIGFISINDKPSHLLEEYLNHLGNLDNMHDVITEKGIEEVIIAIESSDHHKINRIINKLIDSNVIIKVIPSMYDILTGRVRINSILGTPLIQISHQFMPAWQENLKLAMDLILSVLALIITLPISIFLMMGIKLTSKGPLFYSHERIGRYGKPFRIYKFRSMVKGAEKNGPELSSKNDDRITKFGRFMRKSRFDEIPNFINVLKGDMSLVGPRPERKYFIDQIIKKAPHYIHLLKVKPGITSWGQVKYGYAENVDQMIDRLKYDLIYMDNMSIYVDFKIIIYTILTIIKRKGI